MTQGELFMRLLVTIILVTGGCVQVARKSYAIGAVLILMPIAFWLAVYFGK